MRVAQNQMDLFMPPAMLMPPAEPLILPPSRPAHPFGLPEPGDCEWVSFMKANNRVPELGDAKQPWEYKGWLMYYRTMCEMHPDVPARWDYWARTVEAGQLLDEAIPQVLFHDSFERDAEYKLVDKWVEMVHRKQGTWDSMTELMHWFLWGFGFEAAPPKFSAELNELLYREVNIGPLLLRPADYFGSWVSFHKGSWNPHAFFPTPMSVVHFMNVMTFTGKDAEGKDQRLKTVCDPCIGTGRFLLDGSNYSLCLSGIDIDYTNLAISKVNACLYAPWLIRPLPEMVTGYKPGRFGLFRGDSLQQELTDYGLLSIEDSRKYRDLHWPRPPSPEPKARSKKARVAKAQALLEAECSSTVM